MARPAFLLWDDHLRFDPDQVSATTLIGRVAGNHAIRDLFVENPPIEEIIARLYGEVRQ